MGTPYHLSSSSSRRFFQITTSTEHRALTVIVGLLAHPQRTLLTTYIQQASDKELASEFFLKTILPKGKLTIFEFLADWVVILRRCTFILYI
jgi:hypothetical protein